VDKKSPKIKIKQHEPKIRGIIKKGNVPVGTPCPKKLPDLTINNKNNRVV
jgi:hypothetical protein